MSIQARQTSSVGVDERASTSASTSATTASSTKSTSSQSTSTSTTSQSKETSGKVGGSCSKACDLNFNTSQEKSSIPKDCTSDTFIQRASECYDCNQSAPEIITVAVYCKWDSAELDSKLNIPKFRSLATNTKLVTDISTASVSVATATKAATASGRSSGDDGVQVKWIVGMLLAFVPALLFTGAYFLYRRHKRARESKSLDEEKGKGPARRSMDQDQEIDDDSLYEEGVACPKNATGGDGLGPPPELGPHPSESVEAARARKSWRWSWRKSVRGSLDFTVKDAAQKEEKKAKRVSAVLSVRTVENQHVAAGGDDDRSQYDLAIEIVNERGSPSDQYRASIPILRLDIPNDHQPVSCSQPSRLR